MADRTTLPPPPSGSSSSDVGSVDGEDLERQLDQLIPRSQPGVRRFLVSATVVAAAATIAVLNAGGWFYPRPTALGSYSSGGTLAVDHERGLVVAEVMLPNWSRRDLRLTDLAIDAPGARLADVRMALEPEPVEATDGAVELMGPGAVLGWPVDDLVALPAAIPAGRTARLVLWLDPVDCDGTIGSDAPGPWGVADATLDFGDGAFPPFARTIQLDDDPIAEPGDQIAILAGDDLITDDDPLTALCEAVR